MNLSGIRPCHLRQYKYQVFLLCRATRVDYRKPGNTGRCGIMNQSLSKFFVILSGSLHAIFFQVSTASVLSSAAMSLNGKHLTLGSVEPPLESGKIRFYSMRYCPYSHRATLVLLAKDIPFNPVFINLKAKPEWYADRVPTGKVPALLVDGENVYESLILADFLDERFPQRPLHQHDPLLKAKDRILIESFGKVTGPFYKVMTGSNASEEQFQEVVSELVAFENELDRRNTPFFRGEQPGMVDYMIWPWFERLEMFKPLYGDKFAFPEQKLPKLAGWVAAMKQDTAVKQYYLTPEQHAAFMRTHQAGAPDFDILTH